jgi:hypothetical protein
MMKPPKVGTSFVCFHVWNTWNLTLISAPPHRRWFMGASNAGKRRRVHLRHSMVSAGDYRGSVQMFSTRVLRSCHFLSADADITFVQIRLRLCSFPLRVTTRFISGMATPARYKTLIMLAPCENVLTDTADFSFAQMRSSYCPYDHLDQVTSPNSLCFNPAGTKLVLVPFKSTKGRGSYDWEC